MELGAHLTTVGSNTEADVIRGMLEAAGNASYNREATGGMAGSLATAIFYEVLVAEHDLEAAQELLR